MKIFAIIDTNSYVTNGCFHIRAHNPLMELKRRGHEIEYVSMETDRWDEIKSADIVIFGRTYDKPFMGLLWRCKAAGIKVVYELDDDVWNIPESNGAYLSYEKRYRRQIDETIREADMVTTTTEPLKKVLSRLHDNVKVIPNALPLDKWGKRPNHKGLIIGWSGGANHIEDLALVADAIKKLQEKYDFKFVVQGITARPIEADGYESSLYQSIGFIEEIHKKQNETKLNLYKKLLALKDFYHIPFYPPELHPKVLQRADIDIGLIPIKGYKFDESKSILKLLEYTAVGTTAIASDLHPYKGVVPYTTDNDNWYGAIEKLIKDEKLRKELLEKQEKLCFPQYSMKTVGDLWEKAFKELIKK